MSTELVAVQTAVAEFDKVAAGLQALQEQYGSVVYDVTTTAGMADARAARAAVREPRYEIERVRKEAKAPILALGKQLDARAKEITDAIMVIETPIDAQIKAEEARKEAEKQAKIDAEIKRVADIQSRIAELRGNERLTVASGSQLISQHIVDLENIPVDASFEEFVDQAMAAKESGVERLRSLHIAALEHEAEQARLKTEREELNRLRAEQAERDAEARRKLEEEAADRRRQLAIEDFERAERLAAEIAEIAARKAEVDRQEREAQARRDAEEAARQPIGCVHPGFDNNGVCTCCREHYSSEHDTRPALEPLPAAVVGYVRPTDDAITAAVAEVFGVSFNVAAGWLRSYGAAQQVAA